MHFEAGEQVTWQVNDNNATGIIDQVITDGLVPDIAAHIAGPAARVRVVRDGKPTNDFVGIPLKHLDRVSATAGLRREYQIRKPNEDELKVINGMLPSGAEPRNRDNTEVISILAADNLINRGLDKWDLPSLQKMVDLAPGLPAMLDHDWNDVSKVWGKVFSAHYEHKDRAPSAAMDMAGYGKLNRRVIREEGYGAAIFDIFSRPTHPVMMAIKDGYIGKVSTGGFEFEDFYCPECKTSFQHEDCPHFIPDKYWGETHDKESSGCPLRHTYGVIRFRRGVNRHHS